MAEIAQRSDLKLEVSNKLGSRADAAFLLYRSDSTALGGRELDSIIDAIRAEGVSSVSKRGSRLLVRIDDNMLHGDVNDVFQELEWPVRTLLVARPYIVQFLDPNLVKALHVGHLRNAILGWSIASLLRYCGARVVTQCVACDYGRAVGEAMAGVSRKYGNMSSETWSAHGDSPDELIGSCYQGYVAEQAVDGNLDPAYGNDPVHREIIGQEDRAEQLLAKLRTGDADATMLWRQVTSLSRLGQANVMSRLGINIDNWILESKFITSAEVLVNEGLTSKVFETSEEGAVYFPTRLEEFPRLWLTRSDGFPTEHLRALAVWDQIWKNRGEAVIVHLFGEEWLHSTEARLLALKALGRPASPEFYNPISHGHVVGPANAKMGSSAGNAAPIRRFLEKSSQADVVGAWLAILSADRTQKLVFHGAVEGYYDLSNWLLTALRSDPSAEVDVGDAYQRFCLLQVYRLMEVLRLSVRESDPRLIVRWLIHTASPLMKSAHSSSIQRLLVSASCRALGMPAEN